MAEQLLKLRRCLWQVVDFFIEHTGYSEASQKYRVVESFHVDLLRILSNVLYKAGKGIDYTERGTRRNCYE